MRVNTNAHAITVGYTFVGNVFVTHIQKFNLILMHLCWIIDYFELVIIKNIILSFNLIIKSNQFCYKKIYPSVNRNVDI